MHETFGDSYRGIAKKIGVHESYISRLRHGKRTFGLKYLTKIQEAYEIPLPIILLNATKDENVPKKLKPLYKAVKKTLERDIELQEVFRKS